VSKRAAAALPALAAVAAAALIAGPPRAVAGRAKAPRFTTFDVTYEGHGSYDVSSADQGGVSAHEHAAFRWKVSYGRLLILRRARASVGTGVRPAASHGTGEWSINSDNGEERCSRSGGLTLAPGGGITGRVGRSGAVNLTITPGLGDFQTTNPSSGFTACDTQSFWHDWVEGFSHAGSSSGEEVVDPLSAFVDLRGPDLRHGKTIFTVSSASSVLAAPGLGVAPDCGSGDGASCTQSFTWGGHVTLRKPGRPGRHR
jgi:hypothetical protein